MRLRGFTNTGSDTVVISGAAIGDDAGTGAAGSGTGAGPGTTRAAVVNTGIMNIGGGTVNIKNSTVNGEYVEDMNL